VSGGLSIEWPSGSCGPRRPRRTPLYSAPWPGSGGGTDGRGWAPPCRGGPTAAAAAAVRGQNAASAAPDTRRASGGGDARLAPDAPPERFTLSLSLSRRSLLVFFPTSRRPLGGLIYHMPGYRTNGGRTTRGAAAFRTWHSWVLSHSLTSW